MKEIVCDFAICSWQQIIRLLRLGSGLSAHRSLRLVLTYIRGSLAAQKRTNPRCDRAMDERGESGFGSNELALCSVGEGFKIAVEKSDYTIDLLTHFDRTLDKISRIVESLYLGPNHRCWKVRIRQVLITYHPDIKAGFTLPRLTERLKRSQEGHRLIDVSRDGFSPGGRRGVKLRANLGKHRERFQTFKHHIFH